MRCSPPSLATASSYYLLPLVLVLAALLAVTMSLRERKVRLASARCLACCWMWLRCWAVACRGSSRDESSAHPLRAQVRPCCAPGLRSGALRTIGREGAAGVAVAGGGLPPKPNRLHTSHTARMNKPMPATANAISNAP